MSIYYFAKRTIYVSDHHNSLKKKFNQSHPVVAKLEILATGKVQRELRQGRREDASPDFAERYQWEKSKEVLAAMNDDYTILFLMPLTLLI